MEAICTTPRGHNSDRNARLPGAAPLVVALFALSLSGCSIIFPPDGCPSLEEVCPNLACDAGFVVNADGCAQCECAEPEPESTVCWDDSECSDGKSCDTTNFCEAPPGCVEGEACPAVCYGRCVVEPEGCTSDQDCAVGELCFFNGEGTPGEPTPTEPAPPPPDDGGDSGDRACEPNPDGTCGGGGEQDPPEGGLVAPNGVCLPAACPAIGVACADGSEVVWDFSTDPCGTPSCVVVDGCRALDADTCALTEGCRVEDVPQPCGCSGENGADCLPCQTEPVCVSDEVACEQLSAEECLSQEGCELAMNGGEAAPCFVECDESGNNCSSDCGDRPAPPPDDAVCITSESPPPPTGDCVFNEDCGIGQVCVIVDECGSACDPSSNETCPDVCMVIGFCQDEPVTPGCEQNDDCGPGYLCETVEVCACDGGSAPDADPPEGGAAPCLEVCTTEGQCVWNPDNTTCWGDVDCGAEQHCEFLDSCVAPPDCPECLIACQGVCVDNEPVRVECASDEQCGEGEVCSSNTEPGDCNQNPSCVDGQACTDECWGYCIQPEPVVADACLEEADCAEGFRCASEVDSCYCPEGQTCDVCYWQCVPDDTTAP